MGLGSSGPRVLAYERAKIGAKNCVIIGRTLFREGPMIFLAY